MAQSLSPERPSVAALGLSIPADVSAETSAETSTRAAEGARRALVAVAFVTYAGLAVALAAVTLAGVPLPVLTVAVLAAVAAAAVANRGLRGVEASIGELVDVAGRESPAATVEGDGSHDALTGLGTHRAFQEELDRAVETARRTATDVALILIDIDSLGRVNEEHGHVAGDSILVSLARIVDASARRNDRAFRIDGDEVAILCPGTAAEGATGLARRILAHALDGGSITRTGRSFSATIGISVFPVPSADRDLLYRSAAAALSWGKRHGRTDVQLFDPELHDVAGDARSPEEITAAVRAILERRLLRPAYQPVFDLETGAVLGFEALVRPTAGAGFADASSMFTAAELVDRTVELDFAALRVIARGAAGHLTGAYIAVNLSPLTLEATAFNPFEVIGIMRGAGIEPGQVVVELTEREPVRDLDRLRSSLAILRREGIRIAIDDVGAGNAGLRLLSQVEFDLLKVDLSLVQSGTIHESSREILRTLSDLAARRGATAVAEGVETPAHLALLRELGYRVGQGYLLGRPRELPTSAPYLVDEILPAA
jgi:diguanylate cyclase (GGDEF)-like protein